MEMAHCPFDWVAFYFLGLLMGLWINKKENNNE